MNGNHKKQIIFLVILVLFAFSLSISPSPSVDLSSQDFSHEFKYKVYLGIIPIGNIRLKYLDKPDHLEGVLVANSWLYPESFFLGETFDQENFLPQRIEYTFAQKLLPDQPQYFAEFRHEQNLYVYRHFPHFSFKDSKGVLSQLWQMKQRSQQLQRTTSIVFMRQLWQLIEGAIQSEQTDFQLAYLGEGFKPSFALEGEYKVHHWNDLQLISNLKLRIGFVQLTFQLQQNKN